MQAKPAAESFLLALQHRRLEKSCPHGAKALRLSERHHQFLNVPGRRFDVIDVDQRLPLLLGKAAGVGHGLNFHNALELVPTVEAVKLNRQQFELGFFSGPVPMEVPGNQESLIRLLRQSPRCRQNDRPPIRLRFGEMVQRPLVEDLCIDWFASLGVDDLVRFSHKTINSAFCLSWSSKKSFSPRVMRASTS